MARGQRLGFLEQRGDVGGKPGAQADHPHADVVAMKLGEIVAEVTLEKLHQHRDFFGRPAPVLRGEAVDRQIGDAELDRRAHRAAHRLDAAPMALETRQAARLRPAPVAVHDDGDVLGLAAIGFEARRFDGDDDMRQPRRDRDATRPA